ncbi:MAG: hypothetical protein NW241_01905 [Bacteroidia bacterium]|nr:hypothetical protein [Bacteroidia bacterium]
MTIVIKRSADHAAIQALLGKLTAPKKFNAFKYCGVFTRQSSPIEIQQMLRDEWQHRGAPPAPHALQTPPL